jgi:hypothetical protein
VRSIQTLCESELSENLDVENVATLLLIAELQGSISLADKCKQYISFHFDAVSQNEDFQQISANTMREIKELRVKQIHVLKVGNVISVLLNAEKNGNTNLVALCKQFIRLHLDEVKKEEDFQKICDMI